MQQNRHLDGRNGGYRAGAYKWLNHDEDWYKVAMIRTFDGLTRVASLTTTTWIADIPYPYGIQYALAHDALVNDFGFELCYDAPYSDVTTLDTLFNNNNNNNRRYIGCDAQLINVTLRDDILFFIGAKRNESTQQVFMGATGVCVCDDVMI